MKFVTPMLAQINLQSPVRQRERGIFPFIKDIITSAEVTLPLHFNGERKMCVEHQNCLIVLLFFVKLGVILWR